jgi:hypothetical protein
MSRQNQALQIAVVVFAMLAIVLGVTTFLSARRCEDLRMQAQASQESAASSQTLAEQARGEAGELKGFIGFPAANSLQTVREQVAQDMYSCAAALPEGCRSYRAALWSLHDVAQDLGGEVSQQRGEIKSLAASLDGREDARKAQIREQEKAVVQSGKDARNAELTAATELARAKERAEVQARAMDHVRNEAKQKIADYDQKVKDLRQQCAELAAENERLRTKLTQLTRQDFTAAHGTIRRVSEQLHTAWIDLGSADGVRPFLPFDVYPTEAAHLNKSSHKGRIEVTRVEEPHLAAAKIVKDKPNDPMLPGDKVHSPQWKVGQ